MAREPRFPDIDWYCDHCGAYLNSQRNFDDHKYTWKCTSCGYKNSISWDSIIIEDSAITKFFLHLIGLQSYVSFLTAVMLGVSLFVFHADQKIYFIPFLISLAVYLFTLVIYILVEFGLRHTRFTVKNLLFVIFRELKNSIIYPFVSLKEFISFVISFIIHKLRGLPFGKRYKWHSNKYIFVYAFIHVLIFILEFVALSRIIGYSIQDWGNLVMNGFALLKRG